MTVPIQTINMQGVTVSVVREDLNHPVVQGNKLRKLKYNLLAAKKQQASTILTFGGAYSNHLVATAYAAQEAGLHTIGVVRGEELASQPARWSQTLKDAQSHGMKLCFVSRSDYRLKQQAKAVQQLYSDHGGTAAIYTVPEGGSNPEAVQGVAELMDAVYQQGEKPSHVFCPVGTGGTLAGIIQSVAQKDSGCHVLGAVVLKGLHGVKDDINQWLKLKNKATNWQLLTEYHFGGYAKWTAELRDFAIDFQQKHRIPLDKIYNAKSFYALNDWIQQGRLTADDRPLIINTGGLQGGQFRTKHESSD